MASFHLRIVTPDALIFEGDAERLIARTVSGDVAILPRHIDYLTALGTGEARVVYAGHERTALVSGGMLNVSGSSVSLLTTKFEWKDEAGPSA